MLVVLSSGSVLISVCWPSPCRLPPPRLSAIRRELSRIRLRHEWRQRHRHRFYDVVNVRVDREMPLGQIPMAVAANPARNEVYVVNSGSGEPTRAPSR